MSLKEDDHSKNNDKKLDESFRYCQEVAKKNSNFYLGMLLTSKEKRKAFFAIYMWLHAVDDIADDQNFTCEQRLAKLQEFSDITHKVIQNQGDIYCDQLKEKYWLAFRETVITYQISPDYLDGMIQGQKQDLVKYHYANFSELYAYCRLVASMVGFMCICIWGYEKDSNAEQLAEWCGIAFQLTNILRDIKEDVKLGRVYLPAEFVGVSVLTASNFNEIDQANLINGIKKLIEKDAEYYDKSKNLYKYIHKDGKLAIFIMIESYYALFKQICAHPENVLTGKKVRLGKLQKLGILLSAFFKYLFLS